jgi:chromosome segregation ATPase
LHSKESEIRANRQEIENLESELDRVSNTEQVDDLMISITELEKKWDFEKGHVRKLSELVTQKDDLVAEMSSRIKEKNIIIDKMNQELKDRVPKDKLIQMSGEIEDLRNENSLIRNENEMLKNQIQQLEEIRKKSEIDTERVKNENDQIINNYVEQIKNLERLLTEKENQFNKLKKILEDKQMEWERTLDQIHRDKEAQSNKLKRIHLEHEEDIQNLRRDIEQLEKIIDGKDEIIMEMKLQSNNQEHIRTVENSQINEWSREYPKSSVNYNHQIDEEYESTLTMTSTKPKRGQLTTSRGLSEYGADKEELLKEIEDLRKEKYSEQQEMEYQASILKDQLRDLKEELDALRRQNKKLKDLLDEEKDEGVKWRKKFKELENQYKDLIEQFDLFTEKNTKEKDSLEEKEKKLHDMYRRAQNEIRELEIQLELLKKSKNENLLDLLNKFKEKNEGNEENKELLLEVIKKVNELSKQSKCINELIERSK